MLKKNEVGMILNLVETSTFFEMGGEKNMGEKRSRVPVEINLQP